MNKIAFLVSAWAVTAITTTFAGSARADDPVDVNLSAPGYQLGMATCDATAVNNGICQTSGDFVRFETLQGYGSQYNYGEVEFNTIQGYGYQLTGADTAYCYLYVACQDGTHAEDYEYGVYNYCFAQCPLSVPVTSVYSEVYVITN